MIRSVLSPNCVFQFFVGPFYGLTGRSLLLGGAVSSRENLANLAKSGNSVKNLANLAIGEILANLANLANLAIS